MKADERKEQLNRQIGRAMIHFPIRCDLSEQNSFPLKRGRTRDRPRQRPGPGRLGDRGDRSRAKEAKAPAELVLLAEYFQVPITEPCHEEGRSRATH